MLRKKIFQPITVLWIVQKLQCTLLTFLAKVMSNIPPTSNCDCMKGQGLVGVSTNLEKVLAMKYWCIKLLLMFQGECDLGNDMLEKIGILVL